MATPAIPFEDESTLRVADALSQIQGGQSDPLEGNEEAITAVKELAKHFIGLDQWARRQEVIEARRHRFYWRGDQYIYWKSDTIGFIPAQGGTSVAAGDDTMDIPRYTDVYNIFTPYGESILSTLIQNPPGVNWQPEDPSDGKDITGSQAAEKYQQKIENNNERKDLQSEVSRLFFTDGRTVLYTRREDDYEKITAHGVLETKAIPITAKDQQHLVAFFISDELDVYNAKEEYPEHADEIKEGTASLGESAYERIARLGVLQGTRLLAQAGDAFQHMVTRHVAFIRPSAFEKIEDPNIKQLLKQTFQNGLKATFCGDTYCGSEDISMDDEVAIDFPTPGDGMSRPSLGRRLIPLQDAFNDELNLWHEAHDYCVPTLFMYSETGDIDEVREQVNQPGSVVPFTSLPPGATSAGDAFYAAVLEAIPATLPSFIEFIQGPLSQFISGAFPALFGGDTKDNDTAKGIAIQRDQAMGRMSLPWAAIQRIFAKAYLQAVRLAVKYGSEDDNFVYSVKDKTGQTITETISIDDLRNGNFTCIPDTDSSFPESQNAKKSTIQLLMAAAERNPILAGILSQPQNLEFFHEVIGLPDLVVPQASASVKQLIEISELLKETPIPPNPEELAALAAQDPAMAQQMQQYTAIAQKAVAAGQEPPPPPIPKDSYKPSIEVDQDFDFHQYELDTVKDWLSSEGRRKEEAKGNLQGIENVRLHGLQHQNALIKQQMQQMALSGGAPPIGPQAAGPQLKHHAEGGPKPQPKQEAQPAPKVG